MKTPTFCAACAGLLLLCVLPPQAYATITPLNCSDDLLGDISTAGEKDTFSFMANVGERIILRMADGSNSSLTPRIELYAPNGVKINDLNDFSLARINISNASQQGTYVVVASDQSGTNTGAYGLSLQIVKPACTQATLTCAQDLGSESLNGVAAMNAYQFDANLGERIILRMADGSNSSLTPKMELYAPDGSIVGQHNEFSLARLDIQSAPATGTYVLVVMDEPGDYGNIYGLSLQIVKPACTQATLTCAQDLGSESLNGVAAMNAYQFDANLGERIILRMADGPNSSLTPKMELYAPDGSIVGKHNEFSLARLDIQSAPATGTYVLVVMDEPGDYGNIYGLSLQIVKPACTQATLTCTQDLGSESLNGVAAMNAYQFDANLGERIILRMADGSNSSLTPKMELYAPNGSIVGQHNEFALARLDIQSAPATGTYVLVVMDEPGDYANTYGLSLQIVKPACTQATLTCAQNLGSESLNGVAAMNAYQFDANLGERIILRMADGSNSSLTPRMELYAPNGSIVGQHNEFSLARLDIQSAPATGTYVLVVMDEPGDYGNTYGLSLQIVKPACATEVTDCPFNTAVNLVQVAEMQTFTFYAAAGATLNIQMDNGPSSVTPRLELYNPSSNLISTASTFPTAVLNITAPTTGVYRLVVMDDDGESNGACTLSITGCTANANPCTAPAFSWKNAPASVCPGSSVALGIQNADAGFKFELFQDSMSTQQMKPGTGADLLFDSITINKITKFSLRATSIAEPTCVFDLSPALTIEVSGLSFSTTVKDESAFDEDGRITLCVKGGQAPFTFMYEPQRGDSATIPAPDSCAAGFEITNLWAGHYIVVVQESSGCSGTQIVLVGNPDKRRIGFPEKPLLTPNGDGYNDQLVYNGLFEFPDDNDIVIYNRYGSVLYQADPYLNDWDATYQGQSLPADTYFYRLRVQAGEAEQVYTGFITVLR